MARASIDDSVMRSGGDTQLELETQGKGEDEARPVLVGRSGRRIRSDLPGKYHEARKQLQRARVALVATSGLIVLLCALIGFWSFSTELREQSLRQTLHERSASLRQMSVELDRAQTEIERLKLELIPGLHTLERDRAIALEGSAVRSILFLPLPGGVGEGYRYEITLAEDAAEAALADLSILLFDRRGAEIGRFALTGGAGSSPPAVQGLPSGEGHFRSGSLRGSALAQARFFRIE